MYNEDAIERITELVRFHLQANVLALHDARLATIHRPALLKQQGGPPKLPPSVQSYVCRPLCLRCITPASSPCKARRMLKQMGVTSAHATVIAIWLHKMLQRHRFVGLIPQPQPPGYAQTLACDFAWWIPHFWPLRSFLPTAGPAHARQPELAIVNIVYQHVASIVKP